MWWWGWPSGVWWIVPVLCLLLMVGMIVAMVLLARRGGCACGPMWRPTSAGPHAGDTPRQILDRRLAAGELSRDQYDGIRKDLETAGGV